MLVCHTSEYVEHWIQKYYSSSGQAEWATLQPWIFSTTSIKRSTTFPGMLPVLAFRTSVHCFRRQAKPVETTRYVPDNADEYDVGYVDQGWPTRNYPRQPANSSLPRFMWLLHSYWSVCFLYMFSKVFLSSVRYSREDRGHVHVLHEFDVALCSITVKNMALSFSLVRHPDSDATCD